MSIKMTSHYQSLDELNSCDTGECVDYHYTFVRPVDFLKYMQVPQYCSKHFFFIFHNIDEAGFQWTENCLEEFKAIA